MHQGPVRVRVRAAAPARPAGRGSRGRRRDRPAATAGRGRLTEATGVVLAGGRSSRFGRDKLAEPYGGRPILHHAVLRVAEVCAETVLVLSPTDPPPSLPDGVEVRIARDARPGEGPLAGAAAGLAVARSPVALVVAGDMPELQVSVLAALLWIADERGADALALAEGDTVVPMPCVVRVRPAAEAAAALLGAGRRRLRELLEALHVEGVAEPLWRALDPEGRTLLDVDEPNDLSPSPHDP